MQVVANSLAAGMQLVMDMKAAGVKQVVYFFYPNIPKDPGGHEINNYAIPMVKSACEGASDANFQCYFLDTRPILTDLVGDFNPNDQIHPSAQGDEKLADAVWALMKSKCMAQGASSGCCTP
jgi:lysophospholipase L1-like esterase